MASNVKPHQRAFALTIALIFLITTVATSVFVVMAILDENKTSNSDVSQAELNDALKNANSDPAADPATAENALAGKPLANFTPIESVSKLDIIDTKEGTGPVVEKGANVTAHYTGAVAATGVVFQSSYDTGNPVPFSLDGVIKGWTDGVPGMKVGGIRRLVIPADQAYGANPPQGSGIPANAPLVFDIELTAIN